MVHDVVAGALLVLGTGFVLLAAIGLWRFDDVFSRIHAATKATTLGVLLVLAAIALRVDTTDVVKVMLVAGVQLLTAPVAGHMLGRAAYWSGTRLAEPTVIDQLRDADVDHTN